MQDEPKVYIVYQLEVVGRVSGHADAGLQTRMSKRIFRSRDAAEQYVPTLIENCTQSGSYRFDQESIVIYVVELELEE